MSRVAASCRSSAKKSQPAISPRIRSTISNDGLADLDLVKGLRDDIGRGDVVLLVLQQFPHHIEEGNRAVDDEDVLALHLLRCCPSTVLAAHDRPLRAESHARKASSDHHLGIDSASVALEEDAMTDPNRPMRPIP